MRKSHLTQRESYSYRRMIDLAWRFALVRTVTPLVARLKWRAMRVTEV